ncbi:hypothetical protein SLS61_006634 [Didymella pomorum]
MSSGDESAQDLSSDSGTPLQSRASSRLQSQTPGTPRKRRRIESVDTSRVRKYYLEGKYNDAYRVLFNEDVSRVAARFELEDGIQHYTTQYGVSTWTSKEQATLFAALGRLGRDDVAGIAQAVGTKSITETHELLLLLKDATAKKGDLGLTLRDVPAATEVGEECDEELDVMAEALAWYQEQWDVTEERERYGDYWLITPAIAEHIETALNGPSRAVSTQPATPASPGTPRIGPGIAGHHKIRCDRKVPCTNCARMKNKVECKYQPSKRTYRSVDLTPQSPKVEEEAPPVLSTEPQILRDIPQASLLHAENMLSLSRDLFMNRSPDLPSPWPHWSAYASEQVPQPSLMRTALNDFHTLAVSVTKRLMQAAITQATSRLRSQRRRTKKGVMPFVKTRDVLSAIEIVGLKRNGRSRWTGVARRCNVRVFDEQRTTKFKITRREMTWDQAEQILGLYDAVSRSTDADDLLGTPAADSDEAAFKRRAARAGTPLPMEHLSLSNSDSNVELADADSDSASDGSEDEGEVPTPLDRETPERPSSTEPEDAPQDEVREKQTLEQFDQEARREEEEALCSRLEMTIATKSKSPSVDGSEDDERQKLFNGVHDWRYWTDYRAVWEEHETPVSTASFIANQKPRATPAARPRDLDSDASSTASGSPQQSRRKRPAAIELQAQNPRSYAAMQGDIYSPRDDAHLSDVSQFDDEANADIPTQSIEVHGPAQSVSSQDAMDWEG